MKAFFDSAVIILFLRQQIKLDRKSPRSWTSCARSDSDKCPSYIFRKPRAVYLNPEHGKKAKTDEDLSLLRELDLLDKWILGWIGYLDPGIVQEKLYGVTCWKRREATYDYPDVIMFRKDGTFALLIIGGYEPNGFPPHTISTGTFSVEKTGEIFMTYYEGGTTVPLRIMFDGDTDILDLEGAFIPEQNPGIEYEIALGIAK